MLIPMNNESYGLSLPEYLSYNSHDLPTILGSSSVGD